MDVLKKDCEFMGRLLAIYGTEENPLFKLSEVTNVIGCACAEEYSDDFLTEDGLQIFLFAINTITSRQFSTWANKTLRNIKSERHSESLQEFIEKQGKIIERLEHSNALQKRIIESQSKAIDLAIAGIKYYKSLPSVRPVM